MKMKHDWDMMIDLIGGPMDGESIIWNSGDLYPGKQINVFNRKDVEAHMFDFLKVPTPPDADIIHIIRYQIEIVNNVFATARYIP